MQARKACIEEENSKTLRTAILGRARKVKDFTVGDIVYVWRRERGKGAHRRGEDTSSVPVGSMLYWSGPGTVIGIEGLSGIWIHMRGQVLKVPPEYVRLASEEEQLATTSVPEELRQVHQHIYQEEEIM